MTRIAGRQFAGVLASALLVSATLAACGGGGDDAAPDKPTVTATTAPTTEAPGTTAPADEATATTATTATTTTAVPERLRRVPDMAVEDAERGSNPMLSWAPVDGAVLYRVVVLDPNGDAYWAWSGTETSVPVGGNATPTLVGARVYDAMSWQVAAHGADGAPLAMSEPHVLTP